MDNNPLATGEDVETPSGSQPGITTPESSGDDSPQGAPQASPEEAAWNNLKGGTQDRIKQLISERNSEAAKAERLNSYITNMNQTQQYQPQTPEAPNLEVENARKVLTNIGFPTNDTVDQKIQQQFGNLVYNMTLDKLEGRYDGSNGPKFDKTEYQDFVTRNPKYSAYDPEDVYKYHMYPEEVKEAQLRTNTGRGQSATSSLRPTRTTVREEQWSPDWIENRMKQSDGLEWYSKNKDKVNNFLQSTQSS